MSKRRKRKYFFTALAFMLPFLILYTMFTIWPVIQGFYVSLHKWGLMGKQEFVALDNYKKFLGDKNFWGALGNTVKFVILATPMLVILKKDCGLPIICRVYCRYLLHPLLQNMYLHHTRD